MFCTNCGKELPDGSAFCTNCGAKISSDPAKGQDYTTQTPQPEASAAAKPYATTQAQDQANWKGQQASEKSAAAFSSEKKREDDANAITRQIIGKNTEYYLTQFGQMQQGAKSKMNWASFFFSLWHASYRNMWRAWLRAVRLPLIIDFCAWALTGVFLFIQPVASVILLMVAMVAGIWQIIAQIVFAKRFNQCYMKHVEQKLAKHDHSPDPSGGRVIVSYLITAGIGAIIALILSAVILGGAVMAFGGMDMQEDALPDTSVGVPEFPEVSQTDPETTKTINAVNMNDYVGSWMVDRYNSYMDGYVGFVIENNNDQFYFSANGVWNQGDRVTNIEYAQIELNYDGTQAGGYYEDDRGSMGDIILDFENGELYLTITADGGGDYSLSMSHEHCTRDNTAEEGVLYKPESAPETQSYRFYHEDHTYSNGMDSLSGYTIGEDYLWPTDTLTITDGDLNELTRMEVAAIRNEIYARHGYTFSSQEWADLFATATWYVPNTEFSNDMLNTTEKQNVETILAYEKARGWNQ